MQELTAELEQKRDHSHEKVTDAAAAATLVEPAAEIGEGEIGEATSRKAPHVLETLRQLRREGKELKKKIVREVSQEQQQQAAPPRPQTQQEPQRAEDLNLASLYPEGLRAKYPPGVETQHDRLIYERYGVFPQVSKVDEFLRISAEDITSTAYHKHLNSRSPHYQLLLGFLPSPPPFRYLPYPPKFFEQLATFEKAFEVALSP